MQHVCLFIHEASPSLAEILRLADARLKKKNHSPSQSMAFNPSSADPNRRRSRPSAGFRVQFRPATGSQSKCGRLFKKHGLGRTGGEDGWLGGLLPAEVPVEMNSVRARTHVGKKVEAYKAVK